MHIYKWVNAGSGKRHDARVFVALCDQCRHMRVHGPGQPFAALRTKFSARHKHHIGNIGQGTQGLVRQQVGLNAFNALRA